MAAADKWVPLCIRGNSAAEDMYLETEKMLADKDAKIQVLVDGLARQTQEVLAEEYAHEATRDALRRTEVEWKKADQQLHVAKAEIEKLDKAVLELEHELAHAEGTVTLQAEAHKTEIEELTRERDGVMSLRIATAHNLANAEARAEKAEAEIAERAPTASTDVDHEAVAGVVAYIVADCEASAKAAVAGLCLCPTGCRGIDLGDGNFSGCSCRSGKLANGDPQPPGFVCDCPNHPVTPPCGAGS
jgi:hypothetical protein